MEGILIAHRRTGDRQDAGPTSLIAGLPSVFSRTWLVWCLAELGAFAEGSVRGKEGVQKEHGHEAWTLRLLGEIAAQHHLSQGNQAAAYYDQAIALAQELGMRPLLALCHLGLGLLHCRSGRLEQARTVLSTAIELFQAMQMPFWLAQAETARLSSSRTTKSSKP